MKVKFDSSKKHATYLELKPPFPQVISALELDGYGLVLDDAKVKIFIIPWLFLMVFSVAPPPAHSLTPSRFGILKMFRWYISGPIFLYVWFVVLEFWNFIWFHTSKKYNFSLILSGFLDVSYWNVVKFVWNFDQLCNAF